MKHIYKILFGRERCGLHVELTPANMPSFSLQNGSTVSIFITSLNERTEIKIVSLIFLANKISMILFLFLELLKYCRILYFNSLLTKIKVFVVN